jgi:hypothetical protein
MPGSRSKCGASLAAVSVELPALDAVEDFVGVMGLQLPLQAAEDQADPGAAAGAFGGSLSVKPVSRPLSETRRLLAHIPHYAAERR